MLLPTRAIFLKRCALLVFQLCCIGLRLKPRKNYTLYCAVFFQLYFYWCRRFDCSRPAYLLSLQSMLSTGFIQWQKLVVAAPSTWQLLALVFSPLPELQFALHSVSSQRIFFISQKQGKHGTEIRVNMILVSCEFIKKLTMLKSRDH